jgi:hypothetical protein
METGIIRSPQSAIVLPDNFRGGNGTSASFEGRSAPLPYPTVQI